VASNRRVGVYDVNPIFFKGYDINIIEAKKRVYIYTFFNIYKIYIYNIYIDTYILYSSSQINQGLIANPSF